MSRGGRLASGVTRGLRGFCKLSARISRDLRTVDFVVRGGWDGAWLRGGLRVSRTGERGAGYFSSKVGRMFTVAPTGSPRLGFGRAGEVEAGDLGRQLEVENKVIDLVLREVAHPVCKILDAHRSAGQHVEDVFLCREVIGRVVRDI